MTHAHTEHRKIAVEEQDDTGACHACFGTVYHESSCPLFCICSECQLSDTAIEEVEHKEDDPFCLCDVCIEDAATEDGIQAD